MLWGLLVVLLVLMAGFVLVLRAAVVYVGRVLGSVTHERHRAAEGILETGCVPREWRERYAAKRRRGGSGPHGPYSRREARHYLRRLASLLTYFAKAPVFDADTTRAALLDGLRAVQARWVAGDWGA